MEKTSQKLVNARRTRHYFVLQPGGAMIHAAFEIRRAYGILARARSRPCGFPTGRKLPPRQERLKPPGSVTFRWSGGPLVHAGGVIAAHPAGVVVALPSLAAAGLERRDNVCAQAGRNTSSLW
jgi:hypothetical protein